VVIVGVDRRSLAQKTLRIFARAENGIGKTQFHFFLVETFSNYFDIVGIAAGVLNLAPAEVDLALDSEQKRPLAIGFSRFRNIFCDKVLRIVESIPFGSPVVLSFRISPPNGFGAFLSIFAILNAALFATEA